MQLIDLFDNNYKSAGGTKNQQSKEKFLINKLILN